MWHNSKEPHTYKRQKKLPRRFDACGAILSKDFSPHSTKFHLLMARKHKSRDSNAARSAVHCDLLIVANGTNTEKRKGLKMHKELSKALVPNLTSTFRDPKKYVAGLTIQFKLQKGNIFVLLFLLIYLQQ